MENSPTSGETIRHLRNFKNLNQFYTAKKMGIKQQAYSKLERKEIITPHKIAQILNAFGSNLAELEKIKNLHPPPRNLD